MPRPRLLPSDSALQRMVERGMTHQQIADKVGEEIGQTISRSSVAAALSRAGLTEPAPRYRDELPWRVAQEHLIEYPARMLRLLGRRRSGMQMTPRDSQRLDTWLGQLAESGAVVAYSPDRGFLYVPAREGVDGVNGVPIRRTVVTEEMLAV